MNQEVISRILFVVFLMLPVAIRMTYRWKFPQTKDVSTHERSWTLMAIRLWALVVVAYTLGVGWFGYSLPIPEWIRSLGLVGMGLSALFSAWVYHELGIHFSPGIRLLENHDLVTSGPYRWVRHPMYTTFIAHACSTSLACANPFVIIASIIAIAGLVNRIDEEEEILQNRFGEQYLAYMDTTGRLIPKM